jgi:hypothetical protein
MLVQDKMDGKSPIQGELKHQMGTQMAWWCFLDKTTPDIKNNQGKHAKSHNKDAGGNTRLKATLAMKLGKAKMETRGGRQQQR